MSELSIVLFFIFGMGTGLGAFFYSYEKIHERIQENLEHSYELYERNDLWRSNTSLGSQKQP